MKHYLLKLSLSIVSLLIGFCTYSQTDYSLTYDDAGNRTGFHLIEFKTSEVITDSIDFMGVQEEIESYSDEIFSDDKGVIKIKIYPNPTRGELTLEIDGLAEDMEGWVSIFNSSGLQIFTTAKLVPAITIDLADQPSGVYFLKLYIKGVGKSEWKIVKS